MRENGRSYSAANKGSEERRRGDIYLSWKDEAAAAASLAGATKAQEAAAAAEADSTLKKPLASQPPQSWP